MTTQSEDVLTNSINDRFVKLAIKHFLDINMNFTGKDLVDAIKKEHAFQKIKKIIGNIQIEEFESHFLNFEFSGKTWKEQKKEMLSFILDYDYFLDNFPQCFTEELELYNIMHGSKFSKINHLPCYGGITKNIYRKKSVTNYKAYLLNNIKILPVTQEPTPEQNDIKKNLPENSHKFRNINEDIQ